MLKLKVKRLKVDHGCLNTYSDEVSKVIPPVLNDALGFNIDRVANLYRQELMRALADYDLTPEQWQIMALVWNSDEPLNQQEITDLLAKDKPNISRMIRRLEVKGWLERRPDPNDARAFRIHATELGLKFKNDVPRTLYAHFDVLESGLSRAQKQHLVEILQSIRTHFSAG